MSVSINFTYPSFQNDNVEEIAKWCKNHSLELTRIFNRFNFAAISIGTPSNGLSLVGNQISLLTTATPTFLGLILSNALNDSATSLQIIREGGTTANKNVLWATLYNASVAEPAIRWRHSRGTQATPTTLLNGDGLGGFYFQGNTSSGFVNGGYMTVTADGVVSAGVVPGKYRIATYSAVGAENTGWVLDAQGFVGVNTLTPAYQLDVNGTTRLSTLAGVLFGTAGVVSALSYADLKTGAGYYTANDSPTFANITDSGLTITRIPYVSTAGLLVDSANLTYNAITLTQQGTLATDLPTYSAEFLLDTGWTSTDWTGSFALGWTHTSGNTTTLLQSKVAVPSTKYQISWVVSGSTGGTFTIAFGGRSLGGIAASGTWGPTTTSNASLVITPTSAFNGKIVISIKSITAVSVPLQLLKSSDTVSRFEVRALNSANNLMIGLNAGAYTTTGYSNVAVGEQALYNNTNGYENTAIGYLAMFNNVEGNDNFGIGYKALYANTRGVYNVAVGANSLVACTTGGYNTAVGGSTLTVLSGGNYNTAIGQGSLYLITGSNNTGVGYFALQNINGASNDLVALGYFAGRYQSDGSTALTASANSVYIGSQCRGKNNSDSNSIVVGYLAIGQGANTAVWGNTNITNHYFNGTLNLQSYTTAGILHNAVTTGIVSSSLIVNADITANTIQYGSIQQVSATSRVLGRISSGAGNIEELTSANLQTICGYLTAETDPIFIAWLPLVEGIVFHTPKGKITSLAVNGVDGGFNLDDVCTVLGGNNNATIKVTGIDINGYITSYDWVCYGSGYLVQQYPLSGGNGGETVIIYTVTSTNSATAIQNGVDGQVLTMVGGVPTWA